MSHTNRTYNRLYWRLTQNEFGGREPVSAAGCKRQDEHVSIELGAKSSQDGVLEDRLQLKPRISEPRQQFPLFSVFKAKRADKLFVSWPEPGASTPQWAAARESYWPRASSSAKRPTSSWMGFCWLGPAEASMAEVNLVESGICIGTPLGFRVSLGSSL